MNLVEVLEKGGVIAWILLAYSFVALAIVTERLIHFYRLERLPAGFEQDFVRCLRHGQARAWLKDRTGPEANVARAMVAANAEGVRDLSRVATRVGSEELQRMERGLRTLGLLGNTAPLCGLLGTVAGVIAAFRAIEQAGGKVDVNLLAGGIWEAMLTTGMGMAVALPVLFLLHLLEGLADRRAQSMRAVASLIIESLPHSEGQDEGEAAHHREGVLHAV